MINKVKFNKLGAMISTLIFTFWITIQNVKAEVKFSTETANTVKTNVFTPAIAWFMGIAGVVALLACAMQYSKWALKDEEEREQKSYWKTIKPIVVGLIIVESLSTIFLIFSIVV